MLKTGITLVVSVFFITFAHVNNKTDYEKSMANEALTKALINANKELKRRGFLNNYEIEVDGDFSNEYNEVRLRHDSSCFPIASVKTKGEAIVAIKAYLSGFAHGENKSYVRFCDNNYN